MSDQTQTYDPSQHTVAEVTAHLATVDAEEAQRIQEAEAAGKDRATIRDWTPEDVQEGTEEGPKTQPEGQDTVTKAATFSEAAKAAQPAKTEDGYVGFSPERERTGLADKGLSQQTPAILTGGPVPDARPGVDDSEALKG